MNDEQVYAAYPRHVGKIAALKAIAKAVRAYSLEMSVDMDTARKRIYDQVVKYAASPAGNKGMFTPHPATFFNQGRYMDDPAEWWAGEASAPVYREPGIYRGPPLISDEEAETVRRRIM